MSETIIKTALEELVRKHSLAVEELTEQQLAEIIRQAIACGDIQRHVSKRATISAFKTDPQAVLYIPYAREQELESEIARYRHALRSAQARFEQIAVGASWEVANPNVGAVECEAALKSTCPSQD